MDPGYSTPCRMLARNSANIGVRVENTYLHSLTFQRKFLQSVY
jgi:hypothetical protein